MKVFLLATHSGLEEELRPGDVVDFDADEAARLISVGGARALKDDEDALPVIKLKPVKAAKAKD